MMEPFLTKQAVWKSCLLYSISPVWSILILKLIQNCCCCWVFLFCFFFVNIWALLCCAPCVVSQCWFYSLLHPAEGGLHSLLTNPVGQNDPSSTWYRSSLAPGMYISLMSPFWQHLRHQIHSVCMDPAAVLVNPSHYRNSGQKSPLRPLGLNGDFMLHL